jgi:hypothetical protein
MVDPFKHSVAGSDWVVMSRKTNRRGLVAAAVTCTLVALGSQTAVAARLAPLPQSDYAVRPACGAPAPGEASCLALGLEPKTAAARARVHLLASGSDPHTGLAKASECASGYAASCLSPEELRSAYFPGEQPQTPASEPQQTIALVDAYNDLNAEADLNVYSNEFHLPACTTANGCFRKVGENGGEASSSLPFPKTTAELDKFSVGTPAEQTEAEEAEGWALETATDIEVAHAVCQNCHILLVEASSPEYSEPESGGLGTAENRAVALHATEISNSWGGQESEGDSQAFNHPDIAITAAAGDDGYLNWDLFGTGNKAYFEGADYPASSPHVISVGGTHLNLSNSGAWESESAWNSEGAGGSGCSNFLRAAVWQRHVSDWAQVGCGEHRANADVSADADPTTGVNVYDSTPYPSEEGLTVLHWAPIGGTSVASPIIASMIALAGGAHGVSYPAKTIYEHLGTSLLHDVTSGGDGRCDDNYSTCKGSPNSPLDCGQGAWICNTTSGYDGPTGVGTPNGIGALKVGEAPTGGEETGEEGEPKGNPLEEQIKAEEDESGVGNSTGGESPGTGGSSSTSTGTGLGNTTPSGGSRKPGSAAGSVARAARISALALTTNARAAVRQDRLTLTRLAFSFVSSRAATVHVTLAVRVRSGGHTHWRTVHSSLTFTAVGGLNRRRLHGSSGLAPGLYQLKLTPSSGVSRSLTIRVR